jgi:hypothetical protein
MGLEDFFTGAGADTKQEIPVVNKLIRKYEHKEANNSYNLEVAENIKQSEHLRSEINKGTKAGESIEELYRKALKCISLMTGDEIFYKQNINLVNVLQRE